MTLFNWMRKRKQNNVCKFFGVNCGNCTMSDSLSVVCLMIVLMNDVVDCSLRSHLTSDIFSIKAIWDDQVFLFATGFGETWFDICPSHINIVCKERSQKQEISRQSCGFHILIHTTCFAMIFDFHSFHGTKNNWVYIYPQWKWFQTNSHSFETIRSDSLVVFVKYWR